MSEWERLTPEPKPGIGEAEHQHNPTGSFPHRLRACAEYISPTDDELNVLARKAAEVERLIHIVRVFSENYRPDEGCSCALCDIHRDAEGALASFEDIDE